MSTTTTAEGFEKLCRQTSDKWKQYDFPNLPGSSGNALAKFWTTNNMENVASHQRRSSVVSMITHGAFGVGIAICAVPAIAAFAPIVVGLGVSAAVLAVTAKLAAADRKSLSVKSSDVEKMRQSIPHMQEDLIALLDASKAVAKELSAQRDKAGVKQVKESLENFLVEEMAFSLKGPQLDKLLPDRKGNYDFTGLHMCVKTRKELERIESGTKSGKVVSPPQHNVDRSTGRDQRIEPPAQGVTDNGHGGLDR